MARTAVEGGRTSIRHACQTFEVSETCYRYQAKACEENARIADWLVRLTTTYRDWGFGLCFLHLRKVKADAAAGSSSSVPATANSASHRPLSPNSRLPAAAAIPTRVRTNSPVCRRLSQGVATTPRAGHWDDDGSCSDVSAARSSSSRSSQ